VGCACAAHRNARFCYIFGAVGQDDVSFDRAVADFIRAIAVPRRLREPRVADRFRDVEPTMVETRWGDVASWRDGSGPAVLLVHGWEDDSSLWSPLVDALVVRGRSVAVLDLPAHGASSGDWAVSFEGSDAIRAIEPVVGPFDAVVGHSAGCGVVAGAMGEGWDVPRAAFIAPAVARSPVSRWSRKAAQLGVPRDVAIAAEAEYFRVHGPARAAWRSETGYLSLDADILVVQSRGDERNDADAVQHVFARHPRARIELCDDLSHRRSARDPTVIDLVVDFVT
jgi:pimeloyl-ACP methyl ester carboxylesterase